MVCLLLVFVFVACLTMMPFPGLVMSISQKQNKKNMEVLTAFTDKFTLFHPFRNEKRSVISASLLGTMDLKWQSSVWVYQHCYDCWLRDSEHTSAHAIFVFIFN